MNGFSAFTKTSDPIPRNNETWESYKTRMGGHPPSTEKEKKSGMYWDGTKWAKPTT